MPHWIPNSKRAINSSVDDEPWKCWPSSRKRPSLFVPVVLYSTALRKSRLACYLECNLCFSTPSIRSRHCLLFSPVARQAPPCTFQKERLPETIITSNYGQTFTGVKA